MGLNFVINTNGVDFAGTDDAEVLIGVRSHSESETHDLISEALAGNTDPMYAKAQAVVSVSGLVAIAQKAADHVTARVNGNLEGAYEWAPLVEALHEAGLIADDIRDEALPAS